MGYVKTIDPPNSKFGLPAGTGPTPVSDMFHNRRTPRYETESERQET